MTTGRATFKCDHMFPSLQSLKDCSTASEAWARTYPHTLSEIEQSILNDELHANSIPESDITEVPVTLVNDKFENYKHQTNALIATLKLDPADLVIHAINFLYNRTIGIDS